MMWNVIPQFSHRTLLTLGLALILLPSFIYARHLSKSEVDALVAKCEAEREKKIAPLRDQAIQECIAKGMKEVATCKWRYKDLGDPIFSNTGYLIRPRLFHDLPECKKSSEAEKHYRLYPQ